MTMLHCGAETEEAYELEEGEWIPEDDYDPRDIESAAGFCHFESLIVFVFQKI